MHVMHILIEHLQVIDHMEHRPSNGFDVKAFERGSSEWIEVSVERTDSSTQNSGCAILRLCKYTTISVCREERQADDSQMARSENLV